MTVMCEWKAKERTPESIPPTDLGDKILVWIGFQAPWRELFILDTHTHTHTHTHTRTHTHTHTHTHTQSCMSGLIKACCWWLDSNISFQRPRGREELMTSQPVAISANSCNYRHLIRREAGLESLTHRKVKRCRCSFSRRALQVFTCQFVSFWISPTSLKATLSDFFIVK